MTTKTFKIDNQDIPFEPGDTIIVAAARAGIDIPHYCWHPGLSVAANCRMCLVELMPPPGRPALMLDVLRFDPATQSYVKEKKPKLVPACQQTVSDGMVIRSDSSQFVLKARAAVQEFLLLNHPVDCPICDQAGECTLQDYWLEHQQTKKRMRDEPVHKPKAVVFGPTIVYDAERCIACTRCIRFCDEVAKDPVLTLRQRGNLNEIAVAPGRKLDHPYTLMTEYVCPVGALTARDFRFKARVWFLRSVESVCTGCATGCNSYTDFDPRNQKVYRFRPRQNDAVNRHWMCDDGMLSYQRFTQNRIERPSIGRESATLEAALAKAATLLKGVDGKKLALVLGAEFSLEDNAAMYWLGKRLGAESVFESGRPPGEADDILRSRDKNPNTAGIQMLLGTDPLPIAELAQGVESGRFTHLLILGARLKDADAEQRLGQHQGVVRVVVSAHSGPMTERADVVLPATEVSEMEGTYVNRAGVVQVSQKAVRASNGIEPGYHAISMLAHALGHGPAKLTLANVRAMIAAGEAELMIGTEKLASIQLPTPGSGGAAIGWGRQIGPSTDQRWRAPAKVPEIQTQLAQVEKEASQ
ncbi:MAG: 2Fe-2S iron-sulfur cluster-binding protein [Myxococcales bacterium]